MLSAIIDQLLLRSIVQYLFPSAKNNYLKAFIGVSIRVIHLLALNMMKDNIWKQDCHFDFGCDEYNMIMEFLKPYKSYIQMFATMFIDGFNKIMDEIDNDKKQAKLEAKLESKLESKIEAKLRTELRNELQTELRNELQTELRNELQKEVTMINHGRDITLPDDYIHELLPERSSPVVPKIDIKGEFNKVRHLHSD